MTPKLKGYKFEVTIASGNHKVKRCQHLATGQSVAVKIVSFKWFTKNSHGSLERDKKIVQREILLAQHLRHPNVLNCYEGYMFKKRAYIVMELMEGGSLLSHLAERGGTLNEVEARQIASFGEKYNGPEVDVYSCGVTLYHLLHGCPTFESFWNGEVRIPESVKDTSGVYDLITKMTRFTAEKRITIPEIKSHEWFLGGDQEFLSDPPHFDQCIDHDILKETVKKTSCDREDLIQCLIQGQCTEETTTYKLLKKMQEAKD